MARTVVSSGTQTADGSEDVLLDDTSNAGSALDAYVDLSNMIATDTVELRVYVKVLTNGTLHEVYYNKYVGVQLDEANYKTPVVYVPAVTEPFEYKLTLKGTKTAGSYKTFDWTVYKT